MENYIMQFSRVKSYEETQQLNSDKKKHKGTIKD